MRKWWIRPLVLAIVAISVVGLYGAEENVYAAEGEYFDITVTKTAKECEQVGQVIGDGGHIVQESYLDCKESNTEGVVRIASIGEGGDYKIVTDNYKINDIEFSKLGNKSLQIMRRGATTFNTETWTVEAKDTYNDFWGAVSGRLNNNTMTGGVLNSNVTYSFKVGEIIVGSVEEAMTPANGGGSSDEDPCWNAGLDSEGWIVCPTINNLKNTAGPLESMVQSWLTVEPELYNSSSPVHEVWEIMRNIANIAMIIFLLAIIFSQVTGVGIDNYGIKKMLPRLITMALLINLSFVICEIAVDLSNILGVGLRNLFGSIGETLLEGKGLTTYMAKFVSNIVTWIFGAAGVVGAAVPEAIKVVSIAGAGQESRVMVAIIIILALVVVIAALIVFFVMLGARMIIVILCIAVSPVAFALYILPNTQNLFKKWWDVFKAGLIIFPICGAIGGISTLIKAIVLGSSGVHLWMLVVALIAPFLPFFLLPMLLRSAIAALGKVGEAFTGIGNRFTSGVRGATDAVRNSERYKEGMQYARDMAAVRRAQRTRNRFEQRYGRDANGNVKRDKMTARERDRLSMAEQTISADAVRRAQNEVGMNPALAEAVAQSNQENQMVQDELARITTSREIDNIGALGSGLQNALEQNDKAKIRAYSDALASKGELGHNEMKAAWNNAVDSNNMSAEAARTFGSNIANNHVDIKNDARSLFDTASKASQGQVAKTDAGDREELMMNSTAASMSSMDDAEFAQTFLGGAQYSNGNVGLNTSSLDDQQKKAIGQNAYRALQNAQNMKPDRVVYLRKIVEQSGYQPPSS